MTIEDKTALASFLHLAAEYLRDGYTRYPQPSLTDTPPETDPPSEGFSSLPLAYQVDENEELQAAESYAESTVESSINDGDSLIEGDSLEEGDSIKEGDSLNAIASNIAACESCGLAATRTLVVPGEGAGRPLVMVIGEGPGADEDRTGRPFVGKAGQLLDKMLDSIGLSRKENCFIGNMVKCRPPGNRDPGPDEIAACYPYLERQITLLRPQIILCAGRVAAQNLLKTSTGINALRGEIMELKIGKTSIPVLCTFHPSAILRDDFLKRPAWEDLKLLRSFLDDA